MVKIARYFLLAFILLLGACASRMKDQMKAYREAFFLGDFETAQKVLDKSVLKDDKKSALLWHLEKGTLAFRRGQLDESVNHFQRSLALIDELYTKRLSAKAASLLINDTSDVFYGASYERSYAHYFLAKALYSRFQKTGNKLDLQGARGTILAWDTYFTDLQRSSTYKTLYHTDLMLKVFGGEVHEVSDIKGDTQIALQLYKDALQILDKEGGLYSLFNTKSAEYVKDAESRLKEGKAPTDKFYEKTLAYQDLKDFLHYKILIVTKKIRGSDFSSQVKALKPKPEIVKKVAEGEPNVVLIIEEGAIPQKTGKHFNFGLKGAAEQVKDPKTKAFIMTVGSAVLANFAMNKLGMVPNESTSPGSFMFGYEATKLAAQEAAIEFELPMIENVPPIQRLEVFVLDDKGVVVKRGPLPVVSENGDLARIVLEEDVVARYVRTGTRVAVKHLIAIVAAFGVYQKLKSKSEDFLAKTAAMATYIGASKGIAAMEKADTRHWTTLPQAIRMTEWKLPPGNYKVALGLYSGTKAPDAPAKILGDIVVKPSGKSLHTLPFTHL
jgi:tetratricopeptide (TPR) repeat protein